jgi:hypothetical protein
MAKDTNNAIMIDDVEYVFEDLSEKAKVLVQHVADLDRKVASARFNVDQLQVGRDAFYAMLKAELNTCSVRTPAPAAE